MDTLRADLAIMAKHVDHKTKVLDVGCGKGDLLKHLSLHKQISGMGLELNQKNVTACLQKGLSVVQGDADQELKFYPTKSFDFVIASQMLQATSDPKNVLEEMMRIGKKVIISIPNFGHWQNRFHLVTKGRMPVTKTLSYEWFETPNIHFCTLKDFVYLCRSLNIVIRKTIFLNRRQKLLPTRFFAHNLLCEKAIFILEKL